MLNRLLKNKFIRSGAIYSVVNLVVSVIAYILNLAIARGFSLSDYGEYVSAISYITFLGIPLSAFSMVVIRRIGRTSEEDREEVALAIEHWLIKELKQFIPHIILISIILGLGMFYKGNMSLMAIVFIIATALIGIFQSFYGSVLQAYKAFLMVGVFSLSLIVIKALLSFGVILINPNLGLLFFVFIIDYLLAILLGHKMIKRSKKKFKNKIAFKSITSYLNKPSILVPFFTTLGIVGLANADVVLVKKFFDSDITGLYGSLSLLGKIILYVAAPLSAVAFTFFTGEDSKHQSIKILALLTLVIGGLGASATVFYALFPSLVVNIIFGAKFLQVSHLVWMAAVFGSLYSLMNLFAQYFVAKNSKFAYFGILAVVFQTIGIYIFHSSLDQVLWINIIVTGLLVLVYATEITRRELTYAGK